MTKITTHSLPHNFCFLFFFNDTATTEIYTSVHTLSLHDALPICPGGGAASRRRPRRAAAAPARLRSEEHTSELQSRTLISYAVFCLKKKNYILLHNITLFIAECVVQSDWTRDQ